MKNTIVFFALLFTSNLLFAQTESKDIPLSIGYYSQFLIQPGVKIGTHFNFKEWETEAAGKKGKFTKSKSLFVSPQMAFFSRPGNHSNFLLNADVGYKRTKSDRQAYSAWSIGTGYLLRSQITSLVYNLSDGTVKEKNRERTGYVLSTLNYEFGRNINSKIGWYSKYSYGVKLSPNEESAAVLFVELGMNINLNKKRRVDN